MPDVRIDQRITGVGAGLCGGWWDVGLGGKQWY